MHGGAGSKLDQQFEYDGLDRLTSFTSVGATQRFQYDLNGNRIALTLGSASYTNVIDPASNRLSSTTGPAPARRNTYDATGSMTSDGNLRYSYDAGGRSGGRERTIRHGKLSLQRYRPAGRQNGGGNDDLLCV